MSHFGRAGPPDIKDSYSLLVLNITFPDEFAWRQDVEFALQMLSIVNLLLIRRLPVSEYGCMRFCSTPSIKTNFPPRSELEKAIYGPQFSSITAAHIEKNLDGFTVNKVLEKTKLFNPYQHDIFMPCLNRINALSTKVYAFRTILFLCKESTLKPVAIKLKSTTADDLYPLFDRYGKVVDIFIPRDRRTGDSRGFAFVRYKYADEAEKAIERLDGRNVDGRDIVVQFAKYGPNAEVIKKGRLTAEPPSSRRYRSRSPQRSSRRFNDDNKHRDYRRRSRSRDRYERHGYHEREREYRRRSPSRSISPRSRSRSRSKDATNVDRRKRSRSGSIDSLSPVRRSRSPRSLTPQQKTPDKSNLSSAKAPVPASLSPNARSESPKPPSVSPSNSGA